MRDGGGQGWTRPSPPAPRSTAALSVCFTWLRASPSVSWAASTSPRGSVRTLGRGGGERGQLRRDARGRRAGPAYPPLPGQRRRPRRRPVRVPLPRPRTACLDYLPCDDRRGGALTAGIEACGAVHSDGCQRRNGRGGGGGCQQRLCLRPTTAARFAAAVAPPRPPRAMALTRPRHRGGRRSRARAKYVVASRQAALDSEKVARAREHFHTRTREVQASTATLEHQ